MIPTPPRRAGRAAALIVAATLGFSALGVLPTAGVAYADTQEHNGGTATVADVVASGSAIHIQGTGWTHPTSGTGSTIAVKLGDALNTEPVSGPVTNPATGESADGFDIWAAVQAEPDGTFSADIPFPTPDNTTPALESAWAVGTTHSLRLLSGSMRTGDQARSLALSFTIGAGLTSTATTATNGQVTVAFSGGAFPEGEVLSVAKGSTPLQWTITSGRTSTLADTYTVPAAGTLSARVVLAAGTAPAGDLTLTITGDKSTEKNVTVQAPPSIVFDNGTALGTSGTLTLSNLQDDATISSVKLGDAVLASNLTANSSGVATATYAIPSGISPVGHPLVITQTAPTAQTYKSTLTVYPDESTVGAGRFDLTSLTATLYQGLYQSAYSAKEKALYVTASDRGSGSNGVIYKLDPDTLAIQASHATTDHDGFTRTGAFGIGVDDVNGTIWVTNTGSASVAVYKASDLSLVRQFDANTISHPRDIVYDPETDRVFASSASEGSSASSKGYISVFEAKAPYDKVADVQTGTRDVFNPVSLSLDEGRLFSPSLGSNRVLSLDTKTLEWTYLTVDGIDVGGRGASGIAYDAAGKRLFIASQNSNEVVIADSTTGATIKEVPTGRQALNVAFDKVHQLAYVTNFGGTSVSVLDADGNKIGSLPIATANHVSLDDQGNAFVVDKASGNKAWKITPRIETVGGVDILDPTINGVTGKPSTTPLTVTVTEGDPIHLAGTNFRTKDGSTGSKIAVKPADIQGSPTIATIDADDSGAWTADIPFPDGWKPGDGQNLRLLSGALKDGDTVRSIAVKVQVKATTPPVDPAVDTKVTVAAATQTYGKTAELSVTVTPDATGTVSVKAGTKTVTATLSGSKATLTVPAKALAPGKHSLTVSYAGVKDTFKASSATVTATVVKAVPSTTVTAPKKIKRGKTATITVTVKATGLTPTGTITVRLGGTKKTVKLDGKGKAVAKIKVAKGTKPGKKKLTVSYGGSSYVAATKASTKWVTVTR
ncbi:MAG: Ig-like domain repeat protein [Micropruina sp.]